MIRILDLDSRIDFFENISKILTMNFNSFQDSKFLYFSHNLKRRIRIGSVKKSVYSAISIIIETSNRILVNFQNLISNFQMSCCFRYFSSFCQIFLKFRAYFKFFIKLSFQILRIIFKSSLWIYFKLRFVYWNEVEQIEFEDLSWLFRYIT